jgi:8-hydroxy-5-deazaflavin:NADPH oxidoreductase
VTVHIGILGGTGPAGSALAARLAAVDFEVTIGSRSKERAQEVCSSICDKWPDRVLALRAGDNTMAADADVVVVATPWDAAAATAVSVCDQLDGKVVVSMANALVKVGNEFQPLVPPRGSVATHVQSSVPRAMVAAAFHHLPAHALAKLDAPVESDVLICSDHPEAYEATASIVERIPDLRPLDAGSLSNAAPIEAITAVLLQLNVRYRTRTALRLTGIDL